MSNPSKLAHLLAIAALACGRASPPSRAPSVAVRAESLSRIDTAPSPQGRLATRVDSTPVATPLVVPDTLTYTVRNPTVIANVSYSQAAVDANAGEAIGEAVGDLNFYMSAIEDSLKVQGVHLEEANAQVVRVRVDTAWYDYDFRDSKIGFILAAPGRVPKLLEGVHTNYDLPSAVREFLK